MKPRFQAFDMYTDGYFIMNLRLDVCLEALEVPSCNVSINVLKNYYLPKKECRWDAPFSISGNIWSIEINNIIDIFFFLMW